MNHGLRAVAPAFGVTVAALLLGACGSDDDGGVEAASVVATAAEQAPPDPTTSQPAVEESVPVTADESAASSAFADQDAITVAEALLQAYNEYDVGLFKAVTAEDFRFVDERGTTDRDTQASYFPALRDMRHIVQPVGDPAVTGQDPLSSPSTT